MTIPASPIDTAQMVANSGQLPGSTEADSARVELLAGITMLNEIIATHGGATLWSTANDSPLAKVDLLNVFTKKQVLRGTAVSAAIGLTIDDVSTGGNRNNFLSFKVNDSFLNGGIIQNVNSDAGAQHMLVQRYVETAITPASTLRLFEDGSISLSNVVNGSEIFMDAAGAIDLRPKVGQQAKYNGAEISTVANTGVLSDGTFYTGTGLYTVSHSLGVVPRSMVGITLSCTLANGDFSAGDIVSPNGFTAGQINVQDMTTTQLTFALGQGLRMSQKAGIGDFALGTANNWQMQAFVI